MLLIVGALDDPHILRVVEYFKGSIQYTIFDPRRGSPTFSFKSTVPNSTLVFHTDFGDVSVKDVNAIWWRLKPTFGFSSTSEELQPGELDFRESEWATFNRSLPYIFSNAVWINPRDAQSISNNKIVQLSIARSFGFNVPDTIVSNNPDTISTFTADGPTVYKTLSNFVFPDSTYIFTNELTPDDLNVKPDLFIAAPGIFQRKVDKLFELRVTVVSSKVFAVRINSQSDQKTQIDWRRDQLSAMYQSFEIDDNVKTQIFSFMSHFNLSYGAFDFIFTPDGRYIFLECNPAGQWLWLEDALQLPISSAVAELLAKCSSG